MEIEEIRKRIEDVDRQIIELLAERLRLSEEIAKIKLQKGFNIVDDAREIELRLLWRKLATAHNVPLELAEKVLDAMLSHSKDIQFQAFASRTCGAEDIKSTVTIVGYGRMAQALGSLLVRKGCNVIVTGRDLDKARSLANTIHCSFGALEEALRDGLHIILTLSPKAFEDGFIDKIAKNLDGKIVMDILSAKGKAFKRLEELSKAYRFHYVSAHPLFGPSTPAIGQKMVLIPSETGMTVLDDVVKLWRCAGLDVIVASFEEHEKAMAIVQVLTHLILLTFEESVDRLAKMLVVDPLRFSTPTFREVMAIVARLSEIKDVVIEIQKNNVFSPLVHKVLPNVLEGIIAYLGDSK